MNTNELRSKSKTELQAELVALGKELFNLRMQKGYSKMPQNHLFKKVKKTIARVKTLLSEKEGSQS